MIFILSNKNYLYSINTTADVYSAVQPYFTLVFNNKISLPQIKTFINAINIQDYSTYSSIYHGYYATFKKHDFRSVINKLHQNHILTAEDRANIENHVLEYEKIIQNRSLVTDNINNAQADAIRLIISPYIDDFVTIEDQYLSLSLMSRSMLACINDIGQDSDDLIFTQNKPLLEHIKIAIPDPKQREAIYSSIAAIAKLANGSQEMVSTFVRLGPNIPNKKNQLNIIIQELYNTFNRKFNVTENPALKLISYLTLLGYNNHIYNINWNDPENALTMFFNSINDKRNYSSDMIFKYYQNKLVCDIKNAIIATGISYNELNFATFLSQEQLQILLGHDIKTLRSSLPACFI